jgi:toxin ParE1/3/4
LSRYRLTPRALKDLDQIADYTLAQWGERQTAKYLSDMAARFEWLSDNPGAGRIRDEIGEGYRSFRQGSHLIFYIVESEVVAIIGIPHGSMDIDAYFQSPA